MVREKGSVFILLCVAFLTITASFQNCSKVDFAKAPEETTDASTSPLPAGTAVASSVFESAQKPPLDMIWVIDNSGSMGQEAAQVRQNFASFMAQIKADTNVRVALISAPYAGNYPTGVSLSPELKAAGHIQIEEPVGSTNGPELLANALCPARGTHSAPHPCADEQVTGAYQPGDLAGLEGTLSTFFRPNSQKVLVFVTDDNSQTASAPFLSLFNALYNQAPVVYGWVALTPPGAGSCVASESKVYKQMASATNGAVFDICQSDWSAQFNTLARNVIQLVSRAVQLNHANIESIVSVTVNGHALGPGEYQLIGNRVEVNASALTGADKYEVKVTYKYKP